MPPFAATNKHVFDFVRAAAAVHRVHGVEFACAHKFDLFTSTVFQEHLKTRQSFGCGAKIIHETIAKKAEVAGARPNARWPPSSKLFVQRDV